MLKDWGEVVDAYICFLSHVLCAEKTGFPSTNGPGQSIREISNRVSIGHGNCELLDLGAKGI